MKNRNHDFYLKWKVIYKAKNIFTATLKYTIVPIVAINIGFFTYENLRHYEHDDSGVVKIHKKADRTNGVANFNRLSGGITMSANNSNTALHHEIKHIKNTEYGKLPLALEEISSGVAEQLSISSDSTSIDSVVFNESNMAKAPYDVIYYFDNNPTSHTLDSLLNNAIDDWDEFKPYYSIQAAAKALTPFGHFRSPFEKEFAKNMTHQEKLDSAFTFQVNDEKINLLNSASKKTRNRIDKTINENAINMLFSGRTNE